MLATDGQEIASRFNETERDHAGSINQMVDDVLAEAGLKAEQVDAIAVCSGPGSYTGLRIGMATAKGLCYALNKALITNSKLALIFDKNSNNTTIQISLLPARQGEYFMAVYSGDTTITAPTHVTTETLNALLLQYAKYVVTGKAEEDVKIANGQQYICNEHVLKPIWATLAYNNFQERAFSDLATVEPLYLKQVFIHSKH